MQKYKTFRSELQPNDGFGDSGPVEVYIASAVDERQAQTIAIDRAQKAKIEKLENEVKVVTRQRDETFEKLRAAEDRLQRITFGSNK
jgi:hypothetical protein